MRKRKQLKTVSPTFFFKTGNDWLFDPLLVFFRELLSLFGLLVTLDCGQHSGCLFSAHHTNTRVRPRVQEIRTISSTTHAVVTLNIRLSDASIALRVNEMTRKKCIYYFSNSMNLNIKMSETSRLFDFEEFTRIR